MIGPRHTTGLVGSSRRRLTDITLILKIEEAGGTIPSGVPYGASEIPINLGTEGPVISASRIPTEKPFFAKATANKQDTELFPTPPLPLPTAITWPTFFFFLAHPLQPSQEDFPQDCSPHTLSDIHLSSPIGIPSEGLFVCFFILLEIVSVKLFTLLSPFLNSCIVRNLSGGDDEKCKSKPG
ncbi:hypothetical protein SDC9_127178 [bioreactor metagenome]|uniref:Uncharacterized protein n=1 Tax=bioreactor metagenome TaxID=1076179 RepID=A0A645CTW2_9ZZZZ